MRLISLRWMALRQAWLGCWLVMSVGCAAPAVEVDPSTQAPALAGDFRSGFRPAGVPRGAAGLPAGLHRPALATQPGGYVAGELILKLAPAAGETLEAALNAERAPTRTGIGWLDVLNGRYDVTRIEPVFSSRPDFEAIRRKYPERTRRAPPGAEPPDLTHVYKLTMRREADLRRAAADYGAHSDVEYAHPNYLATTQRREPTR